MLAREGHGGRARVCVQDEEQPGQSEEAQGQPALLGSVHGKSSRGEKAGGEP